MRLIDADNMIEDGYTTFPYNLDYCDDGDLCEWLYDQPTIDAVEVVRCKDCEHQDKNCCKDGDIYCEIVRGYMAQDDYCIYGKRREK